MSHASLQRHRRSFLVLGFGSILAALGGLGCASSGQSTAGTGGSGAGAATQCPAGQTLCAGACVSTATDVAHCGACGRACVPGQTCSAGICSGGPAASSGGASAAGGAPSGGTSASGNDTGGGSPSGGSTGSNTGGGSTGGRATGGASTGGVSGQCVPWPQATGTQALTETRVVSGTFDGELKRFTGWGGSQDEDQEPLFRLAHLSTLRNVIIGAPAGDGIHCDGTCTLENVWWEDVGEDAATLGGAVPTQVMTITCAGARSADDKIIQHNGPGTIKIQDFRAEDFGKIYRSCGNCETQYERHVILSNITATGGDTIAGVNTNYGDSASFWNVQTGGAEICERYTGNTTGDEPDQTGTGIDGEYCIELTSEP